MKSFEQRKTLDARVVSVLTRQSYIDGMDKYIFVVMISCMSREKRVYMSSFTIIIVLLMGVREREREGERETEREREPRWM